MLFKKSEKTSETTPNLLPDGRIQSDVEDNVNHNSMISKFQKITSLLRENK